MDFAKAIIYGFTTGIGFTLGACSVLFFINTDKVKKVNKMSNTDIDIDIDTDNNKDLTMSIIDSDDADLPNRKLRALFD